MSMVHEDLILQHSLYRQLFTPMPSVPTQVDVTGHWLFSLQKTFRNG